MPVCYKKELSENTVLAVWKITEEKNDFLNLIETRFHDHAGARDHLHWLASRSVILSLFPGHAIELKKDEFNKPALTVDSKPWHISITHSSDYAAVMVSSTRHVGIDIEKLDARIKRVAHKFINEQEALFIDKDREFEMLTTIWAAKESLYKFYGKKELDFKEHLYVDRFNWQEEFEIKGRISKKETIELQCRIVVKQIEEYVLTYIA